MKHLMLKTEVSPTEVRNDEVRRFTNEHSSKDYLASRGKRSLDICLSIITILALSPIMICACVALALSGSGSVFFRQTRIGKDERPFTLLKFRTMRDASAFDVDESEVERVNFVDELSDNSSPEPLSGLFRPSEHPRLTVIGKFLRRNSIDELPQLINVLRGEMSLVGPRPALPWEVGLLNVDQRRRHDALPGITGLWQVSGRNRLNSAQMIALDLEYISKCSFRLDLMILLATPGAVLCDRYTG